MFKKKSKISCIILVCLMLLLITGCNNNTPSDDNISSGIVDSIGSSTDTSNDNTIVEEESENNTTDISTTETDTDSSSNNLPIFDGKNSSYVINDNKTFFTENELIAESFESYSSLDEFGRCQVAIACLSSDTMPDEDEERGSIGNIKPSGWHTVKYPEVISDLYLYNRCHLIGWQLSGENDNEKNLMTGTRYLNVEGMLPFENQVADYIRKTNNHVMYRVTPVYKDNNLVANGVIMEAKSIEDDSLEFCVWCPNVQPGVSIDYETGESWLTDESNTETTNTTNDTNTTEYVLNTNSMKIHTPDCEHAKTISSQNKETYFGDINDLISNGYQPCKVCNPN